MSKLLSTTSLTSLCSVLPVIVCFVCVLKHSVYLFEFEFSVFKKLTNNFKFYRFDS